MNTADIEQTPASKLLKSGTQIAHDLVAQSPTAVRLLSAQMPFSTFVKYTIWLHELYDTLEIAIQKNSSDPHLSPLSRLDVLARAPALKSDLTNLLSASTKEFQSEKGEQNWREHPFAEAVLKQLPPSLQTYRERIASADGLQLASHAYVRYLGDLSGGQIIQRKLGKAYMLEQLDAKQFYDFPPLDPSQEYPANAAEVKNIKNWFRKSLDIIAQSVEEKQILIDEASKAFIFNSDMFIDLEKHSVTTPELSLPAEQSTTQTARIEQTAPADQTYLRIIFALLLILIVFYHINLFIFVKINVPLGSFHPSYHGHIRNINIMTARRWDGEIVPALRKRLESESSELTKRMSAHNEGANGPLKQYSQMSTLSPVNAIPTPKAKSSRSKDNFAFVEPLPASLLHEKMPDGTASDDSTEEDTFIESTNARIKFPKRNRQPNTSNVLTKSNIPRRVRPRANTNVSMMHNRHRSNDEEMLEIAKLGHTGYMKESEDVYGGYEQENAQEVVDTEITRPSTSSAAKNIPQSTNRSQGGRSYSSFGMYDNQSKPKKKVKRRVPTKGRQSEPYRPPTPETDVDLEPWSVPPSTSTNLPPGKSWDDVVVPTLARKMEMEKHREDEIWSSTGSLNKKPDDRRSKNEIELDTIHDYRASQLSDASMQPEEIITTPQSIHNTLQPDYNLRPVSQQTFDDRSNILRSPVQQVPPAQRHYKEEQRPAKKKKSAKCCLIM
ncbi:hypothetical protein E3Q22_03294 [Wallemia mellicola]|uniref:Heme oxygenase-like protein n=1 Tax=Wallemia mellicola TaxID=1708541 RepID=A0A4T0PLM3_9BASI|nr:hypothetical protein E3Q22_03294 [Wallemia mellicola]TIC10237.1 hypothetical protein E3Q15_03151 [Wallemia mellicola]